MDRRELLHVVGRLQSRQLGLLSTQQAATAGIPDDMLRHLMQAGHLRRVRRGVFSAAGAPATYEQAVLAAVLSASGTAVGAASHTTAAYLDGLPLRRRERPELEVTTADERHSRIAGVRVHRSGHLCAQDVKCVGVIPVTATTRTIVDLSMRLDRAVLGRLADEALRRKLTTLGALQRTALRLRSAPGRSQKRILALVMARTGEDASESDLELFAIAALKRFGVRLPTQQHPVRARGGQRRRVDLCYPREKMAIEALGYEYHGLRSRFDEDAVRNNELVRAGYTPLFVTSAMTDWDIAVLIAEAVGDPLPKAAGRPLTFAQWQRARRR